MYSLRILSKGKVTDLPMVLLWVVFRLPSLYDLKRLRWKQVRCLNASSFVIRNLVCSPYLSGIGRQRAITVISPNGIDLLVYYFFWGGGKKKKKTIYILFFLGGGHETAISV